MKNVFTSGLDHLRRFSIADFRDLTLGLVGLNVFDSALNFPCARIFVLLKAVELSGRHNINPRLHNSLKKDENFFVFVDLLNSQ